MEGSEQITEKTDKKKIAQWVKGAMERLDASVDEKIRVQAMQNCGYNCAKKNHKVIERAMGRRKEYTSTDDFLAAEQQNPMKGTKLAREGNMLYQSYTPQSFTRSMRCYCSLFKGLPTEDTVSLTYNLQRLIYPFSSDPTYMSIDYFDENLNKEDFLKNSLYQASRLKNTKTQTELLFAVQDIYEIQQKAWKLFFDFENIYQNSSSEKKKQLRIETLKRIHDRYIPVLAQKKINSYEDAVKLYSRKREEISEYIMQHSPDHYRTQDALFEKGRIHWDMGMQMNLASEKKAAIEIWKSIPLNTNVSDESFVFRDTLQKLSPIIQSYEKVQNIYIVEGQIQSLIQARQNKRIQEKAQREEKILWPK